MRALRAKWERMAGSRLGRVGGEVEVGGDGIITGIDLDAFAREDIVEVVEIEGGDVALEEGLALEKLALDALCVAARGELMAMAVLLLAEGPGGRAGGAAGVLGVALG